MFAVGRSAEAPVELGLAVLEVVVRGRQLPLARGDLGGPPLQLRARDAALLLGELELAAGLGDLSLARLQRLLDGGQAPLALGERLPFLREVGKQVVWRGTGGRRPASSVLRLIARSRNDVGGGGCLL